MNDRDDYPDDPYRGHPRHERGHDHDPLGDPQPPRGRRARPEPPAWDQGPGGFGGPTTGEFRASGYAPRGAQEYDPLDPASPPPGRRHAEPPGPAAPPRRFGAADALRGGRAARSEARRSPGGPGPDMTAPPMHGAPSPASPPPSGAAPPHGPPASDPTQDALAALANLGESTAPPRPEARQASGAEGPPRRGRRARPDGESGPDRVREEDTGPVGRGGRRRRATPIADSETTPPEEQPQGRRGRRKRSRRDDEPSGGFFDDVPEDEDTFSGSFPGVNSSADTGAFAAVEEEPSPRRGRRSRAGRSEETPAEVPGPDADTGAEGGAFDELDGRPARRRGRRSRADRADRSEEAFSRTPDPDADRGPDTGAFEASAPEEEPEPRGRRSRRARSTEEDEEPRGRRGGRRRRGRREEPEEETEEYQYEEPNLADLAEAYGGGRRSRKKAKELKRARANAGKAGRDRHRRNKTLMIVLALVLLLGIVGGGYGVVRTYVFPPDFEGQGSGEVILVIEQDDSGAVVGANLADLGVVASRRAFTNALEDVPPEELGDGLVPGSYSLARGMSGAAAVAALLDPANRLGGRVTIPEGLRSEEIFQHLSDELGIPVSDFEEAYADVESLGLPEYATQGPEGYLFPETYRFDSGTEAGTVLRTMVAQFHQVAEELDLEAQAAELGRDANEIMAIASIIQAETGTEEDMPLISAVVHNRLELDMELQMDSTCFYVLGEKGTYLNNEQRASCESDPRGYSTYGMVGLPAGPFVPPGKVAIEAALEPADVDYLYFALVDPENGTTGFSTTLEEHNEMVAEHQSEW